jgi:hypothetical protein
MSGIDVQGIFYRGFIVAGTGEAIKLVPVALVAYLVYKRRKAFINPSDFLWLGVLSGAAFGMVEKTFWQGIYFPFTYGPHIGRFYFFPTALGIYASGGQLGYIGHSAATGLLGLALGWGIYFRRKTDSSVGKLWWLFPVIVYAWVVLEHALNNAHYAGASHFLHVLGGGQLTPVFFIFAFIITTVFELYNLFRFFRAHPQAGQGIRIGAKQFFSLVLKNKWSKIPAVFQATLKFYRNINMLSWQSTCIAGVPAGKKPAPSPKHK